MDKILAFEVCRPESLIRSWHLKYVDLNLYQHKMQSPSLLFGLDYLNFFGIRMLCCI